jgi:hypothetical protein
VLGELDINIHNNKPQSMLTQMYHDPSPSSIIKMKEKQMLKFKTSLPKTPISKRQASDLDKNVTNSAMWMLN